MPPPAGSSSFSLESEELSFQTKFLAVVLSFGHLSIKKFSDRTYRLGSKIRQREGALCVCVGGGGGNHSHGLY